MFDPHHVEWTDEKVTRFWDYLSKHGAGEFFSEKHSRDLADRLVGFARPGKVVDIGCGTAPLLAEFARRGIEAVGVDSSPEVLSAARKRAPDATLYLGTAVDLPLADGSVDAALLIEVVEHLDDDTLQATIAEAWRVLRSGGTLMITTPNAEDLIQSTRQCPDCGAQFHVYQHVRRWTPTGLKTFLELRGFRAKILGFRPLENGPFLERVARRAYYKARRQTPRLVAMALKLDLPLIPRPPAAPGTITEG